LARGRITRLVTGALVIAAVFFRIVIMWLYNGSGRSVLVVALFHSAFNSATSLGEQKFTGELISESALLYAIGALVAIVVVVAVFTRGRLAYEPEPAAPRTAEEGGWQPNRGCASQPSFREEPLSAILPVFGIETRRDGQVAAPLPGRPSRPALH
jgi:hypothetical protein